MEPSQNLTIPHEIIAETSKKLSKTIAEPQKSHNAGTKPSRNLIIPNKTIAEPQKSSTKHSHNLTKSWPTLYPVSTYISPGRSPGQPFAVPARASPQGLKQRVRWI